MMKYFIVQYLLVSILFIQFVKSFPQVSPEEESNWRIIDAVSETTKFAAQDLSDKAIDTWRSWSSSLGNWVDNAKNNVQIGLNYIANDIKETKQNIVTKVSNFSSVAEDKYDEVKNTIKNFASRADEIRQKIR
uniref:Salivary secreted protein n=1 Tax=Strongyloides venezuelensis TaxID=75913 RepID=A0A0K0EXT9_STRVS